MQRRDDPQAAAVFDFISSYLDELERGRARPLAEWLERYPGQEQAIAREWLALQPVPESAAGPAPATAEERRIGPYRMLRELGRGGQGAVFLAEDTRIARRVALKILAAHFDSVSEERRKRFRREAEIIARLEHPGICGIYEAEIEGETPYLAMRYVEGETLASVLARARQPAAEDDSSPGSATSLSRIAKVWPPRTPFDVRQVLLYFERAARALHAAHEAGVIHRDIKPGNIMVTQDGQPVLLDFGLAREEDSQEASTLTQSGDIFGTPAYMSPEQLESSSSELDRRTDVYSLGAAMYEALTLHRPFEKPSRAELYLAIAHAPLPDARRHNPALSADVAVVLETALEKERSRRYASALELAEDLRRIREYEPIRARPAGTFVKLSRWTRRNPVLAATLVALAAGLSVALYALDAESTALASERAALRVALGRHLAGRCQALIPEDPSAALVLGAQACELAPNYLTRAALLEALDACHLELELRCEDAPANSVALSPAGTQLAVAFGGTHSEPTRGRVRVFDLARRGQFFDCDGRAGPMTGVAHEPGGTLLFASSLDGRLRAWDAFDGRSLAELDLGTPLGGLQLSHDGTRALAIAVDGRATLCDLQRFEPLVRFDEGPGGIARARFSADGRWIYTSSKGTSAHACVLARWNASNGARADETELPQPITTFECEPARGGGAVLCGLEYGGLARVNADGVSRLLLRDSSCGPIDLVSWSPDATQAVICGGQDETGSAWLVDLRTSGRKEFVVPGGKRVQRAAFSPDGRQIATASYDQCVRTWDVERMESQVTMRGRFRVQELHWTPDGSRVITRNVGVAVMVWFAAERPEVFELRGHTAAVSSLGVARAGQRVLSTSSDGSARLWNIAGAQPGECLHVWRAEQEGGVRCAVLSRDGASAVLGCSSGALLQVALESGATLARVEPRPGGVPRALHFDDSGERLLVIGDVARVLLPAREWSERRYAHVQPVSCAAFLPKGAGLVTGAIDGTVRGWSHDSDMPLWEQSHSTTDPRSQVARKLKPVRSLAVAPGGAELVVATEDGTTCRLSTNDGANIQDYRRFVPQSVEYSADGKRLLIMGEHGGGAFGLVDLAIVGEKPFMAIEIYHLDDITQGAFSPDGSLWFSLSRDGLCYVRDAQGGLPVSQARCPASPLIATWAGSAGDLRVLVGCADGTIRAWPVDPLPCARARLPRPLDEWEIANERRLALPLRYDP